MKKSVFFLLSSFLSLFVANPVWADNQPSFADLWSRRAQFIKTGSGFGSSFSMIFLSSVWQNGQLFSYYVNSIPGSPTLFDTKLALSMDGINFSDYGSALGVGGSWDYHFAANGQLQHVVGRADNICSGWSADVSKDNAGFLAYGPYIRGMRNGRLTAQFALTIDQAGGSNDYVATIEVYDSNSGAFLAQKALRPSDFAGSGKETIFNLPFSNDSLSSNLEFRTYRAIHKFRDIFVNYECSNFFSCDTFSS